MANLWSGRFEKEMNDLLIDFNQSISYSIRLYENDINGSIAHATMLAKQGLITEDERDSILEGLNNIRDRIKSGELKFVAKTEDIHMSIESELIKLIGDPGRKLHTARSRNDQSVLDTRMYLKDEIKEIYYLLEELQYSILEKASENTENIMPGYTHLQHAQPVTIGFYLMAYFQQFKRDMERLLSCYERTDYCPLGAGALAGTSLPIDRHYVAELLGFENVTENALDSVSDRDYVAEFLSFSSICIVHLSRLSEELIIWSTQEFGFIDIDDSYCTGSSIMPQKKNPDIPELIRGKTGRIFGNLMAMLTVLKGLPLAYNKDLQEDKEALFDTIDTIKDCIKIFSSMLKNTTFKHENIKGHMTSGFLNATDLAESLVIQGVPFRTGHELVGKVVKYCESKNIGLEDLKSEDLILIDERLENIEIPDLSNYACVLRRNLYGGTAPEEVKRQIEAGKEFLKNNPFKSN